MKLIMQLNIIFHTLQRKSYIKYMCLTVQNPNTDSGINSPVEISCSPMWSLIFLINTIHKKEIISQE